MALVHINISKGMTGTGRLTHLTKIKELIVDPLLGAVESFYCHITTLSWVLTGTTYKFVLGFFMCSYGYQFHLIHGR